MALSRHDLLRLLESLRSADGLELVREVAERLLQELIEAEATTKIGAEWGTRPEEDVRRVRLEHADDRGGARPSLAAWDGPRGCSRGRGEPRPGRASCGRLGTPVMAQEPDRSAARGGGGVGEKGASPPGPTPVVSASQEFVHG